MPWYKSMSGVQDIARGGGMCRRVADLVTLHLAANDFAFAAVLKDACASSGVRPPTTALPNEHWWHKLCDACGRKKVTSYGGKLLRARLVTALSQSLAIEDLFRINGRDLDKEVIREPIVVMGLPRASGHMAAHSLARSGLLLAPRQYDTNAPAIMSEAERRRLFRHRFTLFPYIQPDFAAVRAVRGDVVDDDLTLHLLTPQSHAWGLLHGLDDYLMECIEEDQAPVYRQVRRVLQLFQWYHHCGHFSSPVTREVEPLNNKVELQLSGDKPALTHMPFLLYSPFALLAPDALHAAFPDARLIWVHRALEQCVPSLCSTLCLHNALYTGRPPSEAQRALMGEKVLGLFGSGMEYAIDYYSQYDRRRMVHWSNRDIKRHATRLVQKTFALFGMELDNFRRLQAINGQTEYTHFYRPLHDAQPTYFYLPKGVIEDAFRPYVLQFQEFAYEKRLGTTIADTASQMARAKQLRLGLRGVSSMPRLEFGENDGDSSRRERLT